MRARPDGGRLQCTRQQGRGKGQGKEAKPDKQDKECCVRVEKGHFAQACWSRIHQDETVKEVEGERLDVDAAKEVVFTNGNMVNDVTLSQRGCECHEDGLVMIDTGASVKVCSKWSGESALEQSDGAVRLQGGKNTPRVRKATNLVEHLSTVETV